MATTIVEDDCSHDDGDEDKDDHGSAPDFEAAARDIQNRASKPVGAASSETRHFREFFGTSLLVVDKLWWLLVENDLLPEKSRPKHLLWTLYFLKVYPKQSPGCSVVGASSGAVDPKTFKKWVWMFIENIQELVDEVIDFDRRLEGDMGNDCLITVDGTDFQIPQKGLPKKGNAFASHKFAGKSALRYELGVSILGGDLVWIQGPYPAGKYTDIKIFNKVLRHYLEPGERVEADDGYRGHASKIKCPKNDANPAANLAMQGRARARHETLNGRLKNWGILKQVFRHHISLHGDVFRACAVLTQLAIDNGEPLFGVDYGD